ncbi:MAG: hypothetical protein KC464_22750, partial [Myxococcales bacterium]|nr:hypothetical protein [Myxococcales bacterium]
MDPTPAQPATPGGHDRGAIGDDATDEALMARVVAGDRAAFTALVLRHRGRAFRIARSLTADDAAAEDVLQ